MTHRSGALSLPLSHEQQESVDVTFFVLVGEGVEEVAEDFGDLVVFYEETVMPVLAMNRAHLASARMTFTVNLQGAKKRQNVSVGLCMISSLICLVLPYGLSAFCMGAFSVTGRFSSVGCP